MGARQVAAAIGLAGIVAWGPTVTTSADTREAPPVANERGFPRAPDRGSPFIVDIKAKTLNIEATIVDLDAGTRETNTAKKDTTVVRVTLDASVFFDTDQHALRPDAQATLRDVANRIERSGTRQIEIAGHTDHRNTDEYNQALSERRASSVRDFLAANLDGVRISAVGYGESRPVAANETPDGEPFPEGMALNRRVEVTYTHRS